MSIKKDLVIIKISGASIKGEKEVIDINFLNDLAKQIKDISKRFKVAIVLGGGNIWRGNIASTINMERYKADQIGMLATVMNSLALQSALSNINVKSNIFSTIEMEKIADNYIIRNIMKSLEKDEIAILSCGTGRPYFSTDTGIAVSAAELHASYILMGKNNVDGVYDKDPNIYDDAVFFKHLTYSKAINDDLKVMDSTAAAICKLINIKTIVFKINEPNGILNALNLKSRFTLISENENDLELLKQNNEFSHNNIDDKEFEDYTDEQVEKFLEEETPIFAKLSDEYISAVENTFKNETPDVIEKKSIKEVNQQDFATNFFNWNKGTSISKVDEKIEVDNDSIQEEKTIDFFDEKENLSNLNNDQDIDNLFNEKKDIDENKNQKNLEIVKKTRDLINQYLQKTTQLLEKNHHIDNGENTFIQNINSIEEKNENIIINNSNTTTNPTNDLENENKISNDMNAEEFSKDINYIIEENISEVIRNNLRNLSEYDCENSLEKINSINTFIEKQTDKMKNLQEMTNNSLVISKDVIEEYKNSIKDIDFYISQVEKIKNETIKENKIKTNEIREFIDKKL